MSEHELTREELLDELARLREAVTQLKAAETGRAQALRVLEEQSAFLNALIVNSPLAIAVVDSQMNVRMCNPAFEHLFQYPPDESIGRNLDLLVVPTELVPEAEELTRKALRVGQTFQATTRRQRKDGSVFDVEVFGVPMMDQGTLIGAYVIYQDITDRRRTEEAVRRRGRQLEILARASQQVNAILEIPAVMRTLVASAMELVDANAGTCGVLRDGQMVFTEYNERGLLRPIHLVFRLGEGVPGYVLQTGTAYVSADAANDPHVIPEIQRELQFRTLADVPIVGRNGQLLGCFEIHNKRNGLTFDEHDVDMLKGLAPSAAVALENAQMLEQLLRAQEAQRRAEEKDRALLHAIPDMMFQIRSDGTYLDFKPSSEFEPYVPPESFLGKNILNVMPPEMGRLSFDAVQQAVSSGETQMLEYQLSIAGEPRDYEARIVKSNAEEVVAIVRDITERKRGEEALRASEQQLRESLAFQQRLIASLPTISLITTDLNAIVTSFSPGAEQIFGYTAEEMIGQPVARLHLPEDVAKFPRLIRDQFEGRVGFNGEITLVRKNGERFPAQFITSPILDEKGQALALLGVSQDITERKRAEAALHERNRQLSVLNAVASALTTLLNVKSMMEILARELVEQMSFRTVFVTMHIENERSARLLAIYPRDALINDICANLGIDFENFVIPFKAEENDVYAQLLEGRDWIGDDFSMIASPTVDPTLARMAQNLLGVRSIHSVPIMSKGKLAGTIVVGSARESISDGERQIVLSSATQVSAAIENARLFEDTQKKNRRLQKLYELSVSLAGDTQSIFDRLVTIVADLLDVPVVSIDEIDDSRLIVRSMYLRGKILRSTSYPIAGTPCEVVRCERQPLQYPNAAEAFPEDAFLRENQLQSYLGVPVLDRRGETVGILDVLDSHARTFSEEDTALLLTFCNRIYFQFEEERQQRQQQESQQALRVSEARYRGLFESVLEGVYQSTPDGRLLTVNPGLVSLLGYDSADELLRVDVGRDLYLDPEEREQVVRKLAEDDEIRNYELVLKRKDGQPVIVLVNSRTVRDEQGKVLYFEGTLTDVSERRTMEEQLRQSQKMEAIGRLAGGVAHDFNNLMTAITGYSDLLLTTLEEKNPLRKDVEEIKKAGTRATALTSQLLAFSRKQVLQPRVLDLNPVVTEVQTMLRRLIGEDIDLITITDPRLGLVRADPGQIEQVILNLAVNARDAMPQGGKLTIETTSVELDETYASYHLTVQPGPYVMLAVSDTGCGMDAEVQSHIFEPFFSTKEAGKGTGLGLSTVYGIVSQSGGHVSVYSEPGRGSTFKVYLPRLQETAQTSDLRVTPGGIPRGSETVLLVEDEGFLRELARKVLEMNGYKVLQASDGAEALSVCSSYNETIHLLVTDVVMPRMSGRELAERLRASMPHLRVLYMSGYTDDAILHHGVLHEDTAFLQKPFTPTALARKVREVLDAPFP